MERVIKILSTRRRPKPDDFSGEFYQAFKEELVPILLKLFRKIETLSNSFNKTMVTLILKPHKDPTRKESNRSIFLINTDAKKPQNLQTKSKNT